MGTANLNIHDIDCDYATMQFGETSGLPRKSVTVQRIRATFTFGSPIPAIRFSNIGGNSDEPGAGITCTDIVQPLSPDQSRLGIVLEGQCKLLDSGGIPVKPMVPNPKHPTTGRMVHNVEPPMVGGGVSIARNRFANSAPGSMPYVCEP
jgi:hypothetical protein